MADPLKKYFDINEENYGHVVNKLIESSVKGDASPEMLDAVKSYYLTAIAKGSKLSDMRTNFDGLSPKKIAGLAGSIPDKKNTNNDGWGVNKSLDQSDREMFAQAGLVRAIDRQWDNLFPEGKNDIILDLDITAQSSTDKIQEFIDRYNEEASKRYQRQIERDTLALKDNPQARAKAGREIDQRKIRQHPDDSLRLQSFDPVKEQWVDGPKLNKFLQKNYEWALYDTVQLEGGSFLKAKQVDHAVETNNRRDISSLTYMNEALRYGSDNVFSPEDLRILISRDPQKIGEMSTGQRWASCMAKGAINFQYVKADISAGSLIAYVIHKDDPQARYPLMRQMLKPFTNGHGDTILVPAFVYGGNGVGNSRTRQALEQVVGTFASNLTRDKSGTYHLQAGLYADGQATTVNLHDEWSSEDISKAITGFLSGSIKEWLSEININRARVVKGERGMFGEDPRRNIYSNKRKIQRALDTQDIENGLPRLFYRTMMRTTLGHLPNPCDIHLACRENREFLAITKAYKDLLKGETNAWETMRAESKFKYFDDLPALALICAPDDPKENSIVDVVGAAINKTLNEQEQIETYKKVLESTLPDTKAHEASLSRMFELADAALSLGDTEPSAYESSGKRYNKIAEGLKGVAPSETLLRAVQGIVDAADRIPVEDAFAYYRAACLHSHDVISSLKGPLSERFDAIYTYTQERQNLSVQTELDKIPHGDDAFNSSEQERQTICSKYINFMNNRGGALSVDHVLSHLKFDYKPYHITAVDRFFDLIETLPLSDQVAENIVFAHSLSKSDPHHVNQRTLRYVEKCLASPDPFDLSKFLSAIKIIQNFQSVTPWDSYDYEAQRLSVESILKAPDEIEAQVMGCSVLSGLKPVSELHTKLIQYLLSDNVKFNEMVPTQSLSERYLGIAENTLRKTHFRDAALEKFVATFKEEYSDESSSLSYFSKETLIKAFDLSNPKTHARSEISALLKEHAEPMEYLRLTVKTYFRDMITKAENYLYVRSVNSFQRAADNITAKVLKESGLFSSRSHIDRNTEGKPNRGIRRSTGAAHHMHSPR